MKFAWVVQLYQDNHVKWVEMPNKVYLNIATVYRFIKYTTHVECWFLGMTHQDVMYISVESFEKITKAQTKASM